jgi:phosphate starvation-inducible protein PhoH and related proteins
VVTGDVTQVDLPGGTSSGLKVVSEILDGVEDVRFSQLDATDVVRHRLVSDIVTAYSRWDEARRSAGARIPHRASSARRKTEADGPSPEGGA